MLPDTPRSDDLCPSPPRTGRDGRPILSIKVGGGGRKLWADQSQGPTAPTANINRNISRARVTSEAIVRGEPQKTDALIAPPRVGTDYLVPSIEHEWAGRSFAWPVLTPMHTDPELGFDLPHWNVDARFITAKMEDHLTAQLGDAYSTEIAAERTAFDLAAAMVLTDDNGLLCHVPSWQAFTCRRTTAPATRFPDWMVERIRSQVPCPAQARERDGRIYCPHRGADLTAMKPDWQGFVLCPLHGLKVQVRRTDYLHNAAKASRLSAPHGQTQ